MKAEITFFTPLLGTLAGDEEIATDHILTKHPEGIAKDELEALDGLEKTTEKASTFFSRNADGKPILWDYQIKGFLKAACEAMISTDTLTKEELKKFRLTRYLYKKTIDNQIFVVPRQILLELPKGCDHNKLKFKQRPLRADTPKGERIALARSEMAPIETKIHIEIVCMNKKLEEFIKQWLNYGALNGIGQWHSGGWGRFSWKELVG